MKASMKGSGGAVPKIMAVGVGCIRKEERQYSSTHRGCWNRMYRAKRVAVQCHKSNLEDKISRQESGG